MVDLSDPAIVEAVTAMNRKEIPELRDLDEIVLAEMPRSCRLVIPLRTKLDFQKISQIITELAIQLLQTCHNRELTTLQALHRVQDDVDRANRIIRRVCGTTRFGDPDGA